MVFVHPNKKGSFMFARYYLDLQKQEIFFFSREVVINIYKKSRGHLHIKEQVSFLLTIDKSSHYTRQRPVRFSRAEVFKILETRVYIQGQMSHILTQVI